MEIIQDISGDNFNSAKNQKEPDSLDSVDSNAEFKAMKDSTLVDVGLSKGSFVLGWSEPKDKNKGVKNKKQKGWTP